MQEEPRIAKQRSNHGEVESLTEDQKALLETGFAGRVEGIVEGEAVHHCPICGELGECYSVADNYHSCKWCGSTWHSAGRQALGTESITTSNN